LHYSFIQVPSDGSSNFIRVCPPVKKSSRYSSLLQQHQQERSAGAEAADGGADESPAAEKASTAEEIWRFLVRSTQPRQHRRDLSTPCCDSHLRQPPATNNEEGKGPIGRGQRGRERARGRNQEDQLANQTSDSDWQRGTLPSRERF